ncbi:unnamed protein product, partial [Meganyctiphanes norvegica]
TFFAKHKSRFYKSHVQRLPNECYQDNDMASLCPDVFCQTADVVLVKLVMLRLEQAREFLETPDLNVKILHLVRDPRAILSSRREAWPNDKYDYQQFCQDMASDH